MVYKDSDKRAKAKPRGRPFVKDNKRGKPPIEVLDDTGHKVSDPRGIISQITKSIQLETLEVKESIKQEDQKIIDSISFTFEKNIITILLKSILKPSGGRYFKVQIFLNDNIEVKPSSFVTKQSALSFWNLLKGEIQCVKQEIN